MRLYFSTGKKRIGIDTKKETYNNNYFYLGGFKDYIKISNADYTKLEKELNFNCYSYEEKF